jgi:hypothetical protein
MLSEGFITDLQPGEARKVSDMLMIDKAEVEGAIAAIKDRLDDARKKEECIAELRSMIGTKQSQMWRSDMGSCAGGLCNISSLIDMEIALLQGAINGIESGDVGKTVASLDEYVGFVNQHYDNERTPY